MHCEFNCITVNFEGEWRGLVVSAEDCHSKGRGIESRSFLFLLFVNVPAANCSEEIVAPSCHEKKGGSGELKRKDRQAFREWLRERLSVRISSSIKW